MMWPFKFTPKPSEISQLCSTVTELAQELRLASEGQRRFSEKLLQAVNEKDAQIRLVLEAKFEQKIMMVPERTKQTAPEDAQYLADVSEMSESSAEVEVERNTASERQASSQFDAALAEELEKEFTELAIEHSQARAAAVQS